eukprot:TRINITY_DN1992_c0_g2_i3.p1 TRINITY_DN1992_c0_g2~~TRINITY_DN1992_c0_g2_i3.p1  ORF type:complete len:574 (-),score=167.56 TRINITY_DN1992_c0_g2_i3:4-1725(-)
MDELYIELWMKIAFHCDIPTFFNFPIISKKWNHNITQHDVWKEYYHANVGQKQLPKQSWRGSLIVAHNTVNRKGDTYSLVDKLIKTEMHILLEKTLSSVVLDMEQLSQYFNHLNFAVSRDNVELAKVLLKFKFPQSKDLKKLVLKRGNLDMILLITPESALNDPKIFFNALESAQSSSIEGLINMGVDINQQNNGDYPIHIVTKKKLNRIIQILIEKKGVSVNLKNQKSFTPLHVAVTQNDMNSVKYLIGKGAFVIDQESNNPHLTLFLAANLSSHEIFFYLLNEHYQDIDLAKIKNKKSMSTLLHIISKSTSTHSFSTMEYLLGSYDFNVNDTDKKGYPPLYYCLFKGLQKEKAELLLKYTADPNYCIIKAIQNDSFPTFFFLMREAPKRIIWDETKAAALHKSGNPKEFIKYLFDYNYDLTYKHNGTSFAHIYLKRSIFFNIGLVKACGMDINDKDEDGKTLLDIAVSNGNYSRRDVVQTITTAGGRLSFYDPLWVLQNSNLSVMLLKEGFIKIPPNSLFLVDSLPYYFEGKELLKFIDVDYKNELGEDIKAYWKRTKREHLLEIFTINMQ